MTESDRSRPRPVPALRRGLEILHLLASRPGPVSASAIARDLGLARSTVYELLGELAAAGFASHVHQQHRWGVGPAAFETGSAYLRGQPLEQLASPILRRLSATTTATTQVAILHGAQTLYLAQRRPLGGPNLVSHVGVRLPATLTATGLAMLAIMPSAQIRALFPSADSFVIRTGRGVRTLPELRSRLAAVRARGWAVEDCQVSPGTASIAAVVTDHNALPVAAVGITIAHPCPQPLHAAPGCGTELAEYSTLVRSAAASLTSTIGGKAPEPRT